MPDADTPAPTETDDPAAEEPGKYTAIVYFHGMGAQRRYEEISRLIDALDRFAYVRRDTELAGLKVGMLRGIQARLEPHRIEPDARISYIRARYDRGEAQPEGFTSTYRFYEAYWAPLAAGKSSGRSVVKWLFAQVPTPFLTLFSRWRDRARLRRAALYTLWQADRHTDTRTYDDDTYQYVLRGYDAFEQPDQRRAYPKGSFSEFLDALTDGGSHADSRRLVELARAWRRAFRRSECFNMAVLSSIVLAIVILGVAVIGSLLRTVDTLMGGAEVLSLGYLAPLLSAPPLAFIIDLVPAAAPPLAVFLALVAAGFALRRFLCEYVGDVQLWTTYQETDDKHRARTAILERGTVLLRHLLGDPQCGRIIVVGHSLGSAIAYDSLLELGRFNRAENAEDAFKGSLPLHLIDHLITLASPIDKIHYFFESHTGKYHRYNRVVDDVRGDIGTAPFARNRKPHIHWVNYWDRADIISATIESASSRAAPQLAVDNVQVSSYLFGMPGNSHSGYFEHEHVMGDLFSVIFHGSHSYREPPRDERGRPDYDCLALGPGGGGSVFGIVGVGLVLVPWLILFSSILSMFSGPTARVVFGVAIVLLLLGGLFALASKAIGHQHTIN